MQADDARLRRWRILIPVLFGVALVAVPTAFTVFPGWTQWAREWRLLLLVVWLLVAISGVVLTARADDSLHTAIAADQKAALLAERRAIIREQFSAALPRGVGGVPAQYHLTVYGPSPDGRFLIPLFPPVLNLLDPAIFPSGAGAVGMAWTRAEGVVVVKGSAASGPEHGLTAIQRRRYSMFRVVAATVIFDDQNERLGVLCAIAVGDDGFFEGLDGIELMRSLAESVAWLVPEAIRWMMPRGEDVDG